MDSSLTKRQKHIAFLCILILGITVLLCIFALSAAYKKSGHSSVALLYQNGTLIQTIPLYRVTSPYTLRIENDHGGVNVVEVRPGSIGIIEANCPDHICMDMGFRSHSALPITCLPNQLVIVFSEEDGADASLDMTTY